MTVDCKPTWDSHIVIYWKGGDEVSIAAALSDVDKHA